MKILKCEMCGNIVTYLDQKVCVPKCCGETMTELVPNSTDAAPEKHLPVVTVDGQTVTVSVSSTEHPMAEDHYIQFIILETSCGAQIKYLAPGGKACAAFALAEGETAVAAYEYCNKHGLWKTEI